MFRGRYEHTVDGKGRTSLPSRFREVLAASGDSRLIVTTGLDGCLDAYPLQEWIAFEERLAALPQFDDTVMNLRRIYVSGAVECELDKLGRLLIPATLRQHAQLKRDVVWAAMGRYVELWDKELFDQKHRAILDDQQQRMQLKRDLKELGL